jgi:hypothetical protein
MGGRAEGREFVAYRMGAQATDFMTATHFQLAILLLRSSISNHIRFRSGRSFSAERTICLKIEVKLVRIVENPDSKRGLQVARSRQLTLVRIGVLWGLGKPVRPFEHCSHQCKPSILSNEAGTKIIDSIIYYANSSFVFIVILETRPRPNVFLLSASLHPQTTIKIYKYSYPPKPS